MHEQYFNFSQRPFSVCPEKDSFFSSPSHREALDAARACIKRGNGPVVLIGGVGTGKSLLLEVIGDRLKDEFDVVSIECSRLEQRSELLQSILFGLDMDFRGMSEGELRLSLIDHLKNGSSDSHGMLLMVDEADRLSIELIDELRLITNVVHKGRSRVQLVIAGTQRLEESLNDPRLASFNQRVALRTFLQNLSRAEVEQYISHHVSRVGRNVNDVFSSDAIEEIAKSTDGCPRLINQLCEQSLSIAASETQNLVDADIVRRSWAELQNLPVPTCSPVSTVADQPSSDNSDCADTDSVLEFGSLDDDCGDTFGVTASVAAGSAAIAALGLGSLSGEAEADNDDLEASVETEATVEVSPQENFVSEDLTSEVFVDTSPEPEVPDVETNVVDEVSDSYSEPTDPFVAASDDPSEDTPVDNFDEVVNDSWEQNLPNGLGVEQFREKIDSTPMPFDVSSFGAPQDPFAPSVDDVSYDEMRFQQAGEDHRLNEMGGESPAENEPVADTPQIQNDQRLADLEREQQELFDQVDAAPAASFSPAIGTGLETDGESEVEAAFQDFAAVSETEDIATPSEAPTQPPQQSQSAPQQSQQPFTDPFDEDFEDEVVIHDAYSPFVAEQNRSSLTVTSDNLSHLTPYDEMPTQTSMEASQESEPSWSSDPQSDADQTNTEPTADSETTSSGMPEGFHYTPSAADASFVPVPSVKTELHVDFDPTPQNTDDVVAETTSGADSVEYEIDPDLVALTSDFPFHDEEEDTDVGSVGMTEQANPSDTAYRYETPFRAPELDDEVKSQAEGIAQELRESFAIEAPQAGFNDDSNSPNQAEHDYPSADSSDSAISPSQNEQSLNILRDLMLQQQTSQGDEADTGDVSLAQNAEVEGEVDSVSVEYPITDHDTYQTPSSIEDDRDMLRVNDSQYNHPVGTEPLPPTPLTEAEPSTGEARRMDYGQLFDQLRNLPKQ